MTVKVPERRLLLIRGPLLLRYLRVPSEPELGNSPVRETHTSQKLKLAPASLND